MWITCEIAANHGFNSLLAHKLCKPPYIRYFCSPYANTLKKYAPAAGIDYH